MTDKEILLLFSICQAEQKVFSPPRRSLPAVKEFDEIVDVLVGMQKAGWIELEVMKAGHAIGGYRRKYKAAAARCTRHGREALILLGGP